MFQKKIKKTRTYILFLNMEKHNVITIYSVKEHIFLLSVDLFNRFIYNGFISVYEVDFSWLHTQRSKMDLNIAKKKIPGGVT